MGTATEKARKKKNAAKRSTRFGIPSVPRRGDRPNSLTSQANAGAPRNELSGPEQQHTTLGTGK